MKGHDPKMCIVYMYSKIMKKGLDVEKRATSRLVSLGEGLSCYADSWANTGVMY